MLFHNQRQFHNRPINNVLSKPIMHKKGKEWIVLSLSALTLGAFGAVTNLNANASAVPNNKPTNTTKVTFDNIGQNQKTSTPQNIQSQASSLHQRIVNNNAKYQHSSTVNNSTTSVAHNNIPMSTQQRNISNLSNTNQNINTNINKNSNQNINKSQNISQGKSFIPTNNLKQNNIRTNKVSNKKTVNKVFTPKTRATATKKIKRTKANNNRHYINKSNFDYKHFNTKKALASGVSFGKPKMLNKQSRIDANRYNSMIKRLYGKPTRKQQRYYRKSFNTLKTIFKAPIKKQQLQRNTALKRIKKIRLENKRATTVNEMKEQAPIDYVGELNSDKEQKLVSKQNTPFAVYFMGSDGQKINTIFTSNPWKATPETSPNYDKPESFNDWVKHNDTINKQDNNLITVPTGYQVISKNGNDVSGSYNIWDFIGKITGNSSSNSLNTVTSTNGQAGLFLIAHKINTPSSNPITPTPTPNTPKTQYVKNASINLIDPTKKNSLLVTIPVTNTPENQPINYSAVHSYVNQVLSNPSVYGLTIPSNYHWDNNPGNTNLPNVMPNWIDGLELPVYISQPQTNNNNSNNNQQPNLPNIPILPTTNNYRVNVNYQLNGNTIRTTSFSDNSDSAGSYAKDLVSPNLMGPVIRAWANNNLKQYQVSDDVSDALNNSPSLTSTNIPGVLKANNDITINVNMIPKSQTTQYADATVYYVYKNTGNFIGDDFFSHGKLGSTFNINSNHSNLPNGYHIALDTSNHNNHTVTYNNGITYIDVTPNRASANIQYKINGQGNPLSSDTVSGNTYYAPLASDTSTNINSSYHPNLPSGYHIDGNINVPFDNGSHVIPIDKDSVTDIDNICFNGDSDANTTKMGNQGSWSSVSAPQGYHFINGSNGKFQFNGGTHTFDVKENAPQEDTDTIVYINNGKSIGSTTINGANGTSDDITPGNAPNLPQDYQLVNSHNNITFNNKHHNIPVTKVSTNDIVEFIYNSKNNQAIDEGSYAQMGKYGDKFKVNPSKIKQGFHIAPNQTEEFSIHNGVDKLIVLKNTDTDSIIFNGDSKANYTIKGSDNSDGHVDAPSGYHFSNGSTGNFTFNNGQHVFNVSKDDTTDQIKFNGDSDANTTKIGAKGENSSVPAPKGYHFTNGSNGQFTFNGGIHVFNVDRNNVTDNIRFNGDSDANTTKTGKPGTNSSVNAPNGYHFINGSNGQFTFNGGTHTFNVDRNNVTDNIKFNGDNVANTTKTGKPGTNSSVNAPNGYHFTNGSNGQFIFNGRTHTFNVAQNTINSYINYISTINNNNVGKATISGTPNTKYKFNANNVPTGYHLDKKRYPKDTINNLINNGNTYTIYVTPNTMTDNVIFNYRGNTISRTRKIGYTYSKYHVNAPQGYHYVQGSNGDFIFNGQDHIFNVDKNNVTDHVIFNGDSNANTTRNGYPGTKENIPVPVHFHYINGSNGQFNLNGGTHTFDVAKNPAHEKLVFNGDSDANHTANGNSDSDGHVNAPNGYHYTNGNGNFKFNNGTAKFDVAGNDASVKFHPILNFYKGGKLIKSITNLDTIVHGKVGQEVTYPEKPQHFINNDLNGFLTNAYSLRASDVNANIQYRLTPNDQSGNNQKEFTLNYDLNQYYTNEISPKIPSNLVINSGRNEANDKINFIYNGKIVGNTTLLGQPNTKVDVNAIQPPTHYFVEPNQQFKYDNQTHNVLVYPNEQPHTTRPLIIHNDDELRKMDVGQTGTYNGHTVTKLSPNFTHWRHLRGVKPYIIHGTFNSVSNPNDSRIVRITPEMRRTYYITAVYKEMFGHVPGYRYEINYNGKPAYITGNPSYTENSYYDENADYNGKTATVEQPVFEYKNINTTWTGTLHPGKKVTLKGIKNISHNPSSLMTRFQLKNGNWISANKNRVQLD